MLCLQSTSESAGQKGAIPSMMCAPVVCLGHNLLAGPIPEQLLGGKKRDRTRFLMLSQPKHIVANALDVRVGPPSNLREPSCQAGLPPPEEEKSPGNSVNRCQFVCLGMEWVTTTFAWPTKADGMHHEGAIPKSASRMTWKDNIVSLGNGLRGLLPRIPGTLSVLSVSENGLEGHMPQLHITAKSTLLVHANDLSCQLPRHQE
eukprot:1146865-Amphidinium_carterae.1